MRRSTWAALPGMPSRAEGVMEPAPIGAAKEGAAGSVIVASARLDGRMQRRASNAAAAAIFSSHRLGGCSLCCAKLWMKLLR